VCHQSVGLVARQLEAAGIATVSLTSAWSITAAVWPPRAAFVDYPLGHTSGRPFAPEEQRAIVAGALAMVETATEPGTAEILPFGWGEDDWRQAPLRGASLTRPRGSNPRQAGADNRTERFDTPQYQSPEDAALAALRHGEEVACRACVGFDA
jgi:hypothetical protein